MLASSLFCSATLLMLSYAMDLEDSHHYPSSDAAASQYAKLASCCHKPSQSIWEYYKSFKEVKKICMVQRSFNYKKLKNWENFQIALTHAVLTHCFLQAVSSNTKNFKTSSQPIDLTVSIVESKTESSSPIQNLYMIALPLNDCLVVAETLLAQDFLTKLYQSQKPSHSLKNILSHSLACLSSYSAKKVFYFKLEDNKTLFENMIVKFIVDFELYYSGITTEKDVDYFITDYIWRSLRLEFVLEQIILPIQHQGLHYLEKACIPLPEMTCNIDLPILNFQHKYTALLLQSYPLIASFSYFFPMSFIAALRTILPQCQEILAEKDASLIKILAVNFLDKVILDFNSQSIYDKYMYMVDGLKLTCLHDLYAVSNTISAKLMHLNALSPNIKKKEDINFQLDILIRDPTSSSFILTQVTPFTLGMIYKEPVTAILASLIRKLNKSVVSYQFPSSTLYARQYFTCFENTFENCKPWFILLNDEFVSTVQSVIVVPFEKELLDVLDFIRQIFVVFPMLQPEIFFNTEDEVAASLQKFFIQNKLTSLEGKLSEFLLSHVSRRILSLPLYSCLKRIWTDASTVPSFLHRSLLRLQLSAKIISKSNSYSYRIIDLYFANACILSHNVAITVSSTCTNSYTDGDSTVNYSLIQAAASAFYTAFPTDMSTNSDKYLLSLQKYILQNRNKS